MIHHSSLATKQKQQAPIAKTASYSGQLAQPGAQTGIIRPHAAIAHRGSICLDHLTRPALAHLKYLTEVCHSLPLHDGRYHFFELSSFNWPAPGSDDTRLS